MGINIRGGLCEYFTVSRVLLVQLLYTEDENVRELYLLSPDAQDRSRECSYRLIVDYVWLDLFIDNRGHFAPSTIYDLFKNSSRL